MNALGELISLRELSRRTKLSPRKVRELRDKHGLPVYDLGDTWHRVLVSEVSEWLAKRKLVATSTSMHHKS